MRISAFILLATVVAAGFASCNKKAATETGQLKIVPFRSGDLWGFSDAKGNIVVEPQYNSTYLMDDGFGRYWQGEYTGLVSPDGKVLTEADYAFISPFSNGLAVFRKDDEFSGYLNEQGQVAIAAQFEEARDFVNGYAFVKKDGKYHIIKPDGSIVKTIGKWMPLSNEPYPGNPQQEVDSGFTLVQETESDSYLMGLIDSLGNTLLRPTYEFLSFPSGGVMVAQKEGKYGLIRTDGSSVIPMGASYIYHLTTNRYLIQQANDTYSVVDRNGQTIIPAKYNSISTGPGETFIVYKGEGVGLLDNSGKELIPMEYNYLFQSNNYLIASKGEGKTGIITTTNQVLLPLQYDNVEILAPDRFLADKNGKRGIIDSNGKVLLPFEFEQAAYGGDSHEYVEALPTANHVTLLRKDGKGYLYSVNGKKISDKEWLYCGYPDKFGLTYATDINGRDSYIGPDGTIYAKDAPLKKVAVNNAQALFDAIGNDVEITLENGQYDLSKVNGGSEFADIFDFSEYQMDDRTIRIKGARNLHIKAKNPGKAEWVIPFAFIPVLKIEGGHNISFSGITMGHNVEPGLCEGAVIAAINVTTLTIDNCDLYGSGTVGIEAEQCSYLKVLNSIIRECTYGILALNGCSSSTFTNCTFKDNKGDNMIKLQYVYGLVFDKITFVNNHTPAEYGPYEFFRFQDDNQTVSLNNCTFTNCSSDYFATYAEGIEEKNVNRKGLKTGKGDWRQDGPFTTEWPETEVQEEAEIKGE